eukprot:957_1
MNSVGYIDHNHHHPAVTMDDLSILVVSITVITMIFGSSIYTISQIRKFKSLMDTGSEFFQIRHPTLTIACIIGFLCVFYIFNPLILLLSCIFHLPTACLYLIEITDSIISILIFPRAMVYCFDRSFVDHLRNWAWRREINPNDTNLFIKHRSICQHAHIIIVTSYVLLALPLFFVLHVFSSIALLIFVSFLYTLTLYLAHNINAVTDEYKVKVEVSASVTRTGGLFILTHVVHYICFHVIPTHLAMHWGVIIHVLLNSAIIIIALYYAVIWTTNQYLFQALCMGSIGDYSCRKRVRFKHIMDHRVGIESFCNHLSREFGLESILFLIEVAQFKSMAHAYQPDIVDNICQIVRIGHSNTFSVNITKVRWLPIDPRMHTQTPYQLALHLYDKYIDESADLCINISYRNRNQIYRDFQSLAQINLDHRDLTTQTAHLGVMFGLFDGAFSEIWHLMEMDSFGRYRATEEYDRLIEAIFKRFQPDHTSTTSRDLRTHMHAESDMRYSVQVGAVSPGESPEDFAPSPGSMENDKSEALDEVGDLHISTIAVKRGVMDEFKDVFEVDSSGIVHAHEVPQMPSKVGLRQSQSLPHPNTRNGLKKTVQEQDRVPTLSLQGGSEPFMSAFDEQDVVQRTETLKAVTLRNRASSMKLPRPTTYRFMIKSASLKADPHTPHLYSINSNNQTKHLTPITFSLPHRDQVILSELC